MKDERNFILSFPKTREDKLNRLISILEQVKEPEIFNMDEWVCSHVNFNQKECGFAGCALGWACIDPIFNNMGLYFNQITPALKNNEYVFYGYDAAKEFFELNYKETEFIFDPDQYFRYDRNESRYPSSLFNTDMFFECDIYDDVWISPEMVIKHIKFVLENSLYFKGEEC